MKRLLFLTLALPGLVMAQKKKDAASIEEMCGCYEVTFNFAETFSPNKDYEFQENYRSHALELVLPIEESKDKIVLQHLLIVRDDMIIKHWRQDWEYQNEDLYQYDHDDTWKYVHLSADAVKGQWTQKVFQVDDGPRYEGSSSWVHVDGKNYWENTTDAPLPRRELEKRSDYNVMERTNRQELTADGWIHIQDNDKILRDADGDAWIASERGENVYVKQEESKCQAARDWWEANKLFWSDVRSIWDEVYASHKTVAINQEVDGKKLYERLFALGEEAQAGTYDSAKTKEAIRAIIRLHLKDQQLLARQ